jgi:hypothetical protein
MARNNRSLWFEGAISDHSGLLEVISESESLQYVPRGSWFLWALQRFGWLLLSGVAAVTPKERYSQLAYQFACGGGYAATGPMIRLCQTLPPMSYSPNSLTEKLPTGLVLG